MLEIAFIVLLIGGAGTMLYLHHRKKLTRIVVTRMTAAGHEGEEPEEEAEIEVYRGGLALRRFIWIPWLLGVICGVVFYSVIGMNLLFSSLFALIIGVLGAQAESTINAKRQMKIEIQLADAIDIIVGALRSGVGLVDALGHALRETPKPLHGLIEEINGRLRLGDNPGEVFAELAYRVPLESFRLFSFTLAVHWEIGGSLAPTLATVGRTIRDRTALARRVRSESMQARASVIAILLITYVLGFIVWRTNPDRVESLLSTQIGQGMFAASVFLQLVGLVWMSKLSDIKY